jgi:catecholate siderophore receptor
MRLRLSLIKTITLTLLLALPLFGEPAPDTVPLSGRVTDSSGAAVASANVTAYLKGQSNIIAATRSAADGSFTLALAPGDYVVHIDANSSLETTESVKVSTQPASRYDFVLQMATVREEITIHAPAGYKTGVITSAMKTDTVLREVPQSVSVVSRALIQDQLMTCVGDAVRYVPGVQLHQGENNRDQLVMRGNSSSADFFLDGVRDDVQYYRDLYNLERVEVLKGPNALIFGRGGAGGVLNRVTKQAGFVPLREVEVSAGIFNKKRFAADVNQPINNTVAFRLNAMNENSGSFRDNVSLKRWGIAPSLAFLAGSNTIVTLGYEHARDQRTADRGITSYLGKPADVAISTYYGNPDDSGVHADVDLGSLLVEHRIGALTIRNRTLLGIYDRGYQNYVPGAASRDKSTVALSAYNNATSRRNAFDQLDVIGSFSTGRIRHTLVGGLELGRQSTRNLRKTGYFNGTATSISVPYASPTTVVPVTFRQSATDASNHVTARVAAAYAQEQLELSPRLKLVAGLRLDHFNMDYRNRRNGDRMSRVDDMVSPRFAAIYSPTGSLSLYASHSISYLPSAGDQFSSLTSITQQLKPEQFTNEEVGLKWDAPAGMSVATAIYRLDRTNTRSTDPNDPTRAIQTGSQRTNGGEITVDGNITPSWNIAGGYAYQDAFVTSATASAKKGAAVGQVPRHSFSLWNRYNATNAIGLALGIVHRAAMFAAIDNTVTLPAYTEVDAAAYVTLRPSLRLQVNVENLLDTLYYANADSNTNITPGSPRSVRLAIITRF